MRVSVLLAIMVGLSGAANAQSSGPNLVLTQHPQLAFNVWPGDFQSGWPDRSRGGNGGRQLLTRVRSIGATHPWAKAGVMFRQSPESPSSPHVMVVVTPGNGVAMQYRPQINAASVQLAVRSGVAPRWVRLTQVQGVFTGYVSADGTTWETIGSITLDWNGEAAVAVTSHSNSALTTAVFEDVRLQRYLSR
jgi:hypothetical protein